MAEKSSALMRELLNTFRTGDVVSITPNLFPLKMRVLNLAPHPDDFDVAAVTFKRMRTAGCRIQVAVLTSGAAGVEDKYCDPSDWETKSATRENEQRKSGALFGLDPEQLEFLRMPEADDGELVEDDKARAILREQLRRFDPQIVVIPHGFDSNSGHRRTYRLVVEQLKNITHPMVLFCCLDPKTLEIRPNAFSWFREKEAAWKRKLLVCHDSQQQRNLNTRESGFDDRILGLNADTAKKHGGEAEYAEAFQVKLINDG